MFALREPRPIFSDGFQRSSEETRLGFGKELTAARLRSRGAALANAIFNQSLSEEHVKTIETGLELIAVAADRSDEELAIDRDLSHREALLAAWADLAAEVSPQTTDLLESADNSNYFVWRALTSARHMPYRAKVFDLVKNALPSQPTRANAIRSVLSDTLRAYDITSVVRDDVAAHLTRRAQSVHSYRADADLKSIYERMLMLDSSQGDISYPQAIASADFYQERALAKSRRLIADTGPSPNPETFLAMLRAGYFIRTSALRNDSEKDQVENLRHDFYAAMGEMDIESAKRKLEEIILINPTANMATSYILLGMSKTDKADLTAAWSETAAEEMPNDEEANRKTRLLQRRLQPVIEDAIDAVLMEATRDDYQNKVYEVLNKKFEPTGLVFRLGGPTRNSAGSPSLVKRHLTIFDGDSEVTIAHHQAGRIKFSQFLKARATGQIRRYESLEDFVATRFPDASQVSLAPSSRTMEFILRSYGHTGRLVTTWHNQDVKHSFLDYLE